MTDNFEMYSLTVDDLNVENMKEYGEGAIFHYKQEDSENMFTYSWNDLLIECKQMPRRNIASQIDGIIGYIRHVYEYNVDERGSQIIKRLRKTTLILGISIDPKHDKEGRAKSFLDGISSSINPLIFYWDAVFDRKFRLLLGHDKSYNPKATIECR